MNTNSEIQLARKPFVIENAKFYRVAMKKAHKEIMGKISKAKSISEIENVLVNDFMGIAQSTFSQAYDRMWKRTPVYFARETYKALDNTKNMNDIFNPINAFKPLMQQRIAQVSITSAKKYGLTFNQATKITNDIGRISKMMNSSIRGSYIRLRAMQISRTETVFASNIGRRAGAQATGIPIVKTWVTMGDPDVRHNHFEVNGIIKPFNEPFFVGGEAMMFPTDFTMGASVSNIANCRCAEKYTIIN